MSSRIKSPPLGFAIAAVLLASQLFASIPDVCCCVAGDAAASCCETEVVETPETDSGCCCCTHESSTDESSNTDACELLVSAKDRCGCDSGHQHLPATSNDHQHSLVTVEQPATSPSRLTSTTCNLSVLDRPPPTFSRQVLLCVWQT